MKEGSAASPNELEERGFRVPITWVSVFGFGGLVAISVGVVLYLGLYAATENTSQLLQARSKTIVAAIEARLDSTLSPVVEQARWIADHVARGAVNPSDSTTMDTFIAGALAATPQVAGIGFVDANAQIRRWTRKDGEIVMENWSNRPDIAAWLRTGSDRDGPAWSPPLWTHTLERTVVFHDVPLRRNGRFIGMLAQVVPIEELSRTLASLQRESTMVPFVLYDGTHVLAHPLLVDWTPTGTGRDAPLPQIEDLGDDVLARLGDPDEVPFFLRGMTGLSAAGVFTDGRYQVLLHRDIARYGPRTWTLGIHFDAQAVAGEEPRRIVSAALVGLVLLALAIAAAILAGRKLSHPIQLLARAADVVRSGRLQEVPKLPGSRVSEIDTALGSFRQMVEGLRERQLIRDALGRFIPQSVARTLLAGGGTLPAEEAEATLLFCDLEGFTQLTERMGPSGIMALLNQYFEAMVEILERHGGIVTQFQGDAILATFNVPLASEGHAADALRAALAMQHAVHTRHFKGERLACRIGINTGPVVAGAVGAKGRLSYTVHGDAVNLAARLEALNKDYGTKILVSAETASRVCDFSLTPVGEVVVRGQSNPVTLFALPCGDRCEQ